MEHRKECGSHRDMLDDALLQRVLEDLSREDSRRCGCSGNAHPGCLNHERPSCGSRVPEQPDCGRREERPGCGCRNERPERPDCGCQKKAQSGCGCLHNTPPSGTADTCRNQPRQEAEIGPHCPLEPECCIAGRGVPTLQGLSLAMVYAPNQDWVGILEPEEALAKGTLFSGLLFPWYPSRCHESRNCGCGRE